MQHDPLETNPAFSTRKLKLGTFQTNLDSGCVMSGLEGRLEVTWPNTVALAKLADEMEFEAIVPVARWRGFGGDTTRRDRVSKPTHGRPASPPRPATAASFQPRTCRSIIRSSPPSNAP